MASGEYRTTKRREPIEPIRYWKRILILTSLNCTCYHIMHSIREFATVFNRDT